MRKVFASLLFCGLLGAQQPQQTPPQQAPQQQTPPQQTPQQPAVPADDTTFRTGIEVVQVPVWVYDKNDNYVDGLQPDQFRIWDNNKAQKILGVDVAFAPISLVILVQANANVEKMLPAINRIGNLIQPQILGEAGEAAVIAYDSRVRVLQEFTHDGDKITQAIKTIQPGSTSQHLYDAVYEATRMLRTRTRDRRRVILLIGEKRDLGSEARAREVLIDMQLANVTLYSVDMSILLERLSAPPTDPRPATIPPAAIFIPGIQSQTPTTVMQVYGGQGNSAEFLPLLLEIYRNVKAIFKVNAVDVFTKGTGGEQFSYYKARGLEKAITDIGEVLHSQYTITYQPDNRTESGFHQIIVDVTDKKAHSVRTKPGYYLGAKQ
jgi:VWFA-related protein